MSGTPVVTRLELKEGLLVAESWQDCEDIIENNKKLQGEQQRSEWGRHTASIPCVIINKWLQEEWDRGNVSIAWGSPEFDAIIQKKINDPDWRWLRVDK